MKKLFVAIFSVFYLGVSSGATIHLHYCMGKLIEWNFWNDKKNDKKCDRCGMPKMGKNAQKGCCNDHQEFIKIVNEQQASTDYYPVFLSLTAHAVPSFNTLSLSPISSDAGNTPVSHAPPGAVHSGIYLLNGVFRI